MKKILSVLLTAAVMLTCAASAFAANDSTVSIKNDSKTVAHGYSSSSKTDLTVSVTNLMTKLDELEGDGTPVTQVLTIKNESNGNSAIDIGLRLLDTNIYESGAQTSASVLNNYSIVITNPSGEIVTEATADDIYKSDADIFVLDLPLGTFNQKFDKETNVYNIEISLDADKDADKIISSIDWNVVCSPSKGVSDTTSDTTAVDTTPSATETPQADSSDTSATDNKKLVKYAGDGKDIVPGKYTITGNGAVKVYNSNNELKTSIILTDGSDPSKKGVEAYSLLLNDGDRIEMADYINLKAINGTSTSAAGTAAGGTATNTASKNTASDKKTNPKTGDAAPVAIISLAALASLGVCAYLEIKKRKTQ